MPPLVKTRSKHSSYLTLTFGLICPSIAYAQHGPIFTWPMVAFALFQIALLVWTFVGTFIKLKISLIARVALSSLSLSTGCLLLFIGFSMMSMQKPHGDYKTINTLLTCLALVGVPAALFALPFFFAKVVRDW